MTLLDPLVVAQAEVLKVEFLTSVRPEPDPRVTAYWERYQQVFAGGGEPQDLKDFANSPVGGSPGNMSVFNQAWNELGAEAAAAAVRDSVDYLLSGPGVLEDRLTDLIRGRRGINGFREALLTKVLCVMYPDRFLTLLKYAGPLGKQGIAHRLWRIELPDPTASTIGELIVESNDLLLELAGEGFETAQHASSFLWWARDRV
ncbi:hypothetical protein ACQPXM_00970 [Kribbella sp. CA-253562]|uniref:hypothetical protein n=1 Tax=Kribbella sp. CA-253562 TaxID=3239942 RepID=UPI003D89ED99